MILPMVAPRSSPHRVHVDLRRVQLQVPEKDTAEIVVIILPGMGQEGVKVPPAFADDLRQTDDFRPRPQDDQQL